MEIQQIKDVASLITPLFLGVFGAWYGSKKALSKFKTEKIWQAKEQSYRKVLELLEAISFWGECEYGNYNGQHTAGDTGEHKGLNSYIRELRKITTTDSIYFSEKFHGSAEAVIKDITRISYEYSNSAMDCINSLEADYLQANEAKDISMAASKWLEVLKREAGSDLKS